MKPAPIGEAGRPFLADLSDACTKMVSQEWPIYYSENVDKDISPREGKGENTEGATFPPNAAPFVTNSLGYLKSSTRNNGEGSPLVPVGLSGLLESRQAG